MKKLNVTQMENLQGGLINPLFCFFGQAMAANGYDATTNTVTNLDWYGNGLDMQSRYCS